MAIISLEMRNGNFYQSTQYGAWCRDKSQVSQGLGCINASLNYEALGRLPFRAFVSLEWK